MEYHRQLSLDTSGQRKRFLNAEFSSPVTPLQRTFEKEKTSFPAPGWTLLRQFTCKQLYRRGNVAQVMHEQICLVSDTGNVHYFSNSSRRDGHVHSLVSRDADEKCTVSAARKQSSGSDGQTSSLKIFLKLCLTSILLLLLVASSLITYRFVGLGNNVCQYSLKTNVLEQVLKYKLYGQEQASKEIMTHLMLFSVSEGPRVEAMVFYGDTGVGKSYAASLIGKYFTWPRNVQYLISSVHDHSIFSADDVISNLSLCGDNLVIVDELSVKQEGASVRFLDQLFSASKSSGFRIIVILIFNVQQNYGTPAVVSRPKIENIFKLKADLIFFQPLEKQHIKMCVREAVSQQEILTTKADVDNLLSIVVPLRTGCKSVAGKVAILGGKPT